MSIAINELIKRVDVAVNCGEKNLNSKLTESILSMGGMSSREVRIMLNELIKEDTNYLEIGLYTGSTFVSAMYGNKPKLAVAIDSFADYFGESGQVICKMFKTNCAKYNITDFSLIEKDSFNLSEKERESIKDINIYFYDGGHDYRDHYLSLKYFYANLADNFILIVDDWVDPLVQEGTNLAINSCKLKIHKDWSLGRSQHLKHLPGLTWHNGIYIAVLSKL